MVIVAGTVLMAVPPAARAGDDVTSPLEVTLTGGFVSAPGSGRDPTTGLGIAVGPDLLRVRAAGVWTRLHKDGTPGGYAVSGSVGAEVFLGGAFIGGGVSRSFLDQTVWTKRAHFAYGTAGYRWTGVRHERGKPKDFHEAGATYFRETFSTYANRTVEYRVSYAFDHRLGTGHACVRLGLALGAMYFDQHPYPGAERRRGMTGRYFIGISLR